MNIGEVELTNFTSHDHSTFKLPARGIVAITGENGAGKSSIVEGVAWCIWGKTLRGTTPWRGDAKDAPCEVRVTTDLVEVTRGRSAKATLDWSTLARIDEHPAAEGGEAEEFPTPTKAAEALHRITGPFDLWRRSHVFSSADAAHFTLATDADRKRLIETFLGNDRFDPAVERCRADLKQARASLDNLVRKRDVAAARLTDARTRLTETKKQLASAPDLPAPPAEATGARAPGGASATGKHGRSLADYDTSLQAARREVNALTARLRTLDAAGGELVALARTSQALLDRLRADKCPTCTQAITPAFRQRLHVETKRAKDGADAAKAEAEQGKADLQDQLQEIEEEIAALQRKRNDRAADLMGAAHAKEAYERAQRQRLLLEQTLRAAGDSISVLTVELVETEETIDSVSLDVAELEATEHVLGLKGVRAHILGKSLGGIEAVANAWLGKLHGGDLRLSLRPYSELKKGGVDDSISIEVSGVGGGLGYKASSGGERRRLDISLLLAMAEVASAARGQDAGTLFFDEALDALDDAGVDAVASALGELARTRAVVVITHNKTLLERLPAAQRVRVVQGRLSGVG